MITLTPAYGRDYKSKKAAINAIAEGEDFILNDMSDPYDGKPCSPATDLAGQTVKIRYDRLRKVAVVKFPAEGC